MKTEKIAEFLNITSRTDCFDSLLSGRSIGGGCGLGCGVYNGAGNIKGSGCGYGRKPNFECNSESGYVNESVYGFCYDDGCGCSNSIGQGVKSINGNPVYMVAGFYVIIHSVCGDDAEGKILQDDGRLCPCCIVKIGEHFGVGQTRKEAIKCLMKGGRYNYQ